MFSQSLLPAVSWSVFDVEKKTMIATNVKRNLFFLLDTKDIQGEKRPMPKFWENGTLRKINNR